MDEEYESALPLDDIRIGSVVKCNPFLDWLGRTTSFKFKFGDVYGTFNKYIEGEITVERIDEVDKVVIDGNYYARQMLLVKGVDYE